MTLKNNLKIVKMFNDTGNLQLAIIIAIQSIHGVKILTKEKLLELRTSIPQGFTGPVYIYITKGKPYLFDKGVVTEHYVTSNDNPLNLPTLNGRVVAKFWFDEWAPIYPHYERTSFEYHEYGLKYYVGGGKLVEVEGNKLLRKLLQLDDGEIENYLVKDDNDREGYGWFIKNLEILDEPMKLGDFYRRGSLINDSIRFNYKPGRIVFLNPLERAPQSWMYAWVKINA